MPRVLNMSKLLIWQSSKSGRALNMWMLRRVLNMPEGWMNCTKLFIKPRTGFFGIDEMYNLVMDEMYEISWIWIFWIWIWTEFALSQLLEHKPCCGETHVDVVVLVVWVVFVWFVVWYVCFIKLGCIRRCSDMKENILNFGLSPLCLVYMKFLMA